MSSAITYLPRHLDGRLAAALEGATVVVLDGPRGVGKTTTAARVCASQVLLPRDLPQLSADPESYLRSLVPPVLVDEWQLAGTDLLWTIKRIVDDDLTPGRFLLTGSVEPAASGPTYPLTARAARLVMRPMTLPELEGRGSSPTFLSRVLAGGPPPVGQGLTGELDIAECARPGFPGARDLPDSRLFLDAYAAFVSQRAGAEGRDASRLLRTMRVLATLSAQAAPDQRIWQAADINKATWKQYEDLLTRVHLATPLPAFDSNRLSRLTAYPKRFLADTALALALADLDVGDLRADPTTAGRFLESYVVQQLRPQADHVGGHVMHVRTAAGEREVDAVVETSRGVFGFEVKLTRRPRSADARPLEWLRDQLSERFLQGFVVHRHRLLPPRRANPRTPRAGPGVWLSSVAARRSRGRGCTLLCQMCCATAAASTATTKTEFQRPVSVGARPSGAAPPRARGAPRQPAARPPRPLRRRRLGVAPEPRRRRRRGAPAPHHRRPASGRGRVRRRRCAPSPGVPHHP